VIYESPKRIIKLLKDINNEIPGCAVSVCSELTKLHESCIHGKIDEVYEKMKDDPNSLKGEYVVLISNEPENKKKENISIEAMLIDVMIKENCLVKEAIGIVNKQNDNLSKKDIYNASLNLKEIFKKITH